MRTCLAIVAIALSGAVQAGSFDDVKRLSQDAFRELAKDIASGLAYGAAIIGGQIALLKLANVISDFKEARKLRKAREAEPVSDETKPENPEDNAVVNNHQNK